MARNTGRGSRSAQPGYGGGGEWLNGSVWRPLVVWAEPEGVAIYRGEKHTATHRDLLTPDEAEQLADLLRTTAAAVRKGL